LLWISLGRDYETKHYSEAAKKRYELIQERNKVLLQKKNLLLLQAGKNRYPNALYLAEEMPLLEHFFSTLGVETIVDDNFKNAIKSGKKIAGAEFCAPMMLFSAMYKNLADKCDYIFLPRLFRSGSTKEDAYRLLLYLHSICCNAGSRN